MKINESQDIKSILAARLHDHANFLRNIVRNMETLKSVPNHHDCVFGKWCDQHKEKLGQIHSFTKLYDEHKQLHMDARALVSNQSIQNVEKLLATSESLLESFMNLSKDARKISL
ncbi:CZB domain-containing protein [Bacillus massiliigorillae]|uniref:CZB domain-containing protein n=1 Tax=Bacillus massiliigorillae TaxID=1243664 RepID=UPI003F6C2EF2